MTKERNITVVDYGMGNIWSVLSALRYLRGNPGVSGDPEEVRRADALVLPGVGSFRKAMHALRATGLDQAVLEAVRKRGVKILGICLGMQLMGSHGKEDGDTEGLGLVSNRVDRFTPLELGGKKMPHIGFNAIRCTQREGMFSGLPESSDFYFVHSYRMLPENLTGRIATCNYGIDFLAAFEIGNVYGTQFHPEKSQTNGLILLKKFLEK